MRYFTKELWGAANYDSDYQRCNDEWNKNLEEYVSQLEQLKSRLSKNAWRFFSKVSLHDGTLLSFEISDVVDCQSKLLQPFIKNNRRTSVKIQVLTYEQDKLYTLRYSGIRKVVFDFPSDKPLFHDEGDPIEDWGYDELTQADKNYFSHEILFSSGATAHIEFKHFSYTRKRINSLRLKTHRRPLIGG